MSSTRKCAQCGNTEFGLSVRITKLQRASEAIFNDVIFDKPECVKNYIEESQIDNAERVSLVHMLEEIVGKTYEEYHKGCINLSEQPLVFKLHKECDFCSNKDFKSTIYVGHLDLPNDKPLYQPLNFDRYECINGYIDMMVTDPLKKQHLKESVTKMAGRMVGNPESYLDLIEYGGPLTPDEMIEESRKELLEKDKELAELQDAMRLLSVNDMDVVNNVNDESKPNEKVNYVGVDSEGEIKGKMGHVRDSVANFNSFGGHDISNNNNEEYEDEESGEYEYELARLDNKRRRLN